MIREPAVQATIVGDPLVRGERVSAVLHRADVATSTVEFRLSGGAGSCPAGGAPAPIGGPRRATLIRRAVGGPLAANSSDIRETADAGNPHCETIGPWWLMGA